MAYSYSAVKSYEGCPAAYKFSRIDRLPNPSGPAAARGTMLHSELEEVLKGGLPVVSAELQHLLPWLEELKTQNAMPEREFSIDANWNAVSYKDPTAWFRGIIDVYLPTKEGATIIDWKSGKKRDYLDQVTVYASIMFAVEPTVTEITPVISFVDLKKEVTYTKIHRNAHEGLRKNLEHRITVIEEDRIFAPNPSINCRWCAYSKNAGGPCKW